MKYFLLLILAIHWTTGFPAYAQSPDETTDVPYSDWPEEAVQIPAVSLQFENLTVNDGLSDGSVQAIVQDHLGYLWFGTGGGLDRYDGYEFKSYKPIPFDSTSLTEGLINGVYEDEEGTLWITTSRGGLDLLDARREQFKHYYFFDKNDPRSVGHYVLCKVHPSWSNALWICTLGGGLDRLDLQTETFEHYRNIPGDTTSLSNNYVYDVYEDPTGYTWVATGNGLNRLNPERDTFTHYFHTPGDPDSPSPVPGQWFRYIHPDPVDPYLLWLGSGDGLIRFDTRTGRHRRYLSTFIFAIVDDPNESGVLWLATTGINGGLYRFDTQTGHYSHYQHDPRDSESLISNRIFSITADRSGMIWTGSANGRGISRFDPEGAAFQHYRSGTEDPVSLSLPSVLDINEDVKGRLWVAVMDAAGQGELNRIDRKTGEVNRYIHDPANPNSLGTGVFRSLHVDTTGMIWVGSDEGLERLDPETGQVVRFNLSPQDLQRISWQSGSTSNIQTIYRDHSNNLWIGTSRGLYKMNNESETFTRYLYDSGDSRYILNQDITALLEDHSGTMWVGTLGGLYSLDSVTGDTLRFVHNPNDPSTLSEDLVIALHEREREPGILWVGTRSGGLNRFDTNTGVFTHFTTEDGLSDNRIYAILEDDFGNLWMSTNRGLSSFDPENQTFTNYGVRDGLQSMEFNLGAAYRSDTGELFFGGPNGLNAFSPEQLQSNPNPPEVLISDFRLFNKPVKAGQNQAMTAPIWQTDDIELRYDQNTVSFGFAAFHYKDPERNVYTYRLDPVDDDWIESRDQRSVTYSNLQPGSYTFRVKAANSDGIWNETGDTVHLTIAPPWWRTGWAYGLYALLFIAGFFVVDRVQRRRLISIERDRARERELEQEKTYTRQLEEAYSELENSLNMLTAAQDQLVQQEKLASLGQLTAGIAHEIKNPLNFVNNFSDLSIELVEEAREELRSEKAKVKSKKEKSPFERGAEANARDVSHMDDALEILNDIEANLRKIHEHGSRADGIVKSMLQHSRGGDGKMEPTPLNPLIKEYVNLAFHGMRAGKKPINVDIELDLNENAGNVNLIAEDFSRVILNLCHNAFDAMREKLSAVSSQPSAYEPKLTVRTFQKDKTVTIKIEDNGPGIPEDIKDKILQPFFTTKKGTQGTGLGLSITNDIVKAHGGEIAIHTKVNEGTEFTIVLPA